MTAETVDFGRLDPNTVASKLLPGHAVQVAWELFKTTQPDEYMANVENVAKPAYVEDTLFTVFLRGWVAAGGKI